MSGIKSSISTGVKEKSLSSSNIIETLDVKTTKSILLRRVLEQCEEINDFNNIKESTLIKLSNVELKLTDEENLKAAIVLRKDALKGFKYEGLEVNNLISSIFQDYQYVLKGKILNNNEELIIKIPLEIQSEFESKYNINDLLIGKVSIIGIYKGLINKNIASSSLIEYFTNKDTNKNTDNSSDSKIINSNSQKEDILPKDDNRQYHFIDIISVIQEVKFKKLENNIKPNLFIRILNCIKRCIRK